MGREHKRLSKIRSHAELWLPKNLAAKVVEYSRSWQGLFAADIKTPNLTLRLPIDENRWFMNNETSGELAIYDRTTHQSQDFGHAGDLCALNANEFIFRGKDGLRTVVNLSTSLGVVSELSLGIFELGLYVLDGAESKIILAYVCEFEECGLCIFDHVRKSQWALTCSFFGQDLCPLLPFYFASLPTPAQGRVIEVFKVFEDLSTFEFVILIKIPNHLRVNYRV
jgi:hypothetical protein